MTVIRDQVLAKIPGGRVQVYVVWHPVLPTDNVESLPEAMRLLAAEPRASQYWDPSGEIGRRFARALRLPVFKTAWDVYLIYSPQTRWDSSPPVPAFWMHQLSFAPLSEDAKRFRDSWLDGERFREQLEKQLAGHY